MTLKYMNNESEMDLGCVCEAVHPSSQDRQVGGTHYQDMPVQPWDVLNQWPLDQQIGFYRGTALGYLMRAGLKGDPLEEFEKAHHTLERLIEIMRIERGEI